MDDPICIKLDSAIERKGGNVSGKTDPGAIGIFEAPERSWEGTPALRLFLLR
jgi:hypothetical protein